MQSKISPVIIKNSNLITEAPNDETCYVRYKENWVDVKDKEIQKLMGIGNFNGEGGGFPSNTIDTPSGDKLYRHPSNLGSVLISELNINGIFIFDAKFRTINNFAKINSNSGGIANNDIPDIRNLPDLNTSDYNSTNWRKNINACAAIYCSQFSVEGKRGCLPNIQVLQKIWMNKKVIDDNDVTVKNYPDYALNDWFKKTGNSAAWSSTYYGVSRTLETVPNGFNQPNGTLTHSSQSTFMYGIIPIVEL